MNKIFIVTGEVSGDILGAWYLERLLKQNQSIECHAVGGNALKEAGANLYARMEDLNVVGFVKIVQKLPFILQFLKQLVAHIIELGVDEVVLVDFPGFNLKLAKLLKKHCPTIKITYLSPPQLWAWGGWRIKKLKKYCDRVIVLYPFEVEWYKQRGLEVEWLGYPHYKSLETYFDDEAKQPMIAWLVGSRPGELDEMFAIMVRVIIRLKLAHPRLQIMLPLAESFSRVEMKKRLQLAGLMQGSFNIHIVEGRDNKLKALSQCCVALAKPGTSTLELALLKVPTVVMYKTSWITYFMCRPFVRITQMALPNLLLGKQVYKEFIQSDCKVDAIFAEMTSIYTSFVKSDPSYQKRVDEIGKIRDLLIK